MDNYLIKMMYNKKSSSDEIIEAKRLVNIGLNTTNLVQKKNIYEKALYLHPRNGNALVQLGIIYFFNKDMNKQSIGTILLEKAFDNNFAEPCIPVDSQQGSYLSTMMARYFVQINFHQKAKFFFLLSEKSLAKNDNVTDIQLATLITGYPKSCQDAKNIIKDYKERMDKLLNLNLLNISSALIDSDPYLFSILSAFNIEIYYEADIREMMRKNYLLTIKAFPEYKFISPYIEKYENKIKFNQRYKVGIASGLFYKNNSVLADFQGVLDRLSRSKFDITYIYLQESHCQDSEYLAGKDDKSIIVNTKDNKWLINGRKQIGQLKLDLILYLDSTMSTVCHRMLMSKLANIQAVSHGHPITTGVDREIMDYYISWGAAELDYYQAKNHYTEKLLLLPKDKLHQYYEPRITKKGLSVINNLSVKGITRHDFKDYIPIDGNWYVCMQKPFKRHPEFDNMLASILQKDRYGRLLLHDSDNYEIATIVKNRLMNQDIDMNRVHFIPCQPHNKLMGLYSLSDVILDSYYAGGCTTTREALELGTPVVTLPGKYLGSRWSLAYYSIMNVYDMIAKNKEDYVNLCVKIAIDKTYRGILKNKILSNIHKLFYQNEAVESWSNLIESMILNKIEIFKQ